MPFKLTKDHIGKKVRQTHWISHAYFIPNYVEESMTIGRGQDGAIMSCSAADDERWDFYEEPIMTLDELLVPNADEIAAIYLIPKLANNQSLQQIPEKALKILDLKMDEWMQDTVKEKESK